MIRIKWTKIRPGLYEYTDPTGTLWTLEHVSPAIGFAWDEWHVGPEGDEHADQYETKRDATYHLERHLEKTIK